MCSHHKSRGGGRAPWAPDTQRLVGRYFFRKIVVSYRVGENGRKHHHPHRREPRNGHEARLGVSIMPWRLRWRSLSPWTAFQSARSPTASLAAQTRNDSLSLVRMHKPQPRETTGFHAKRAKAQSPSNPSKNGLKSTSKPKATGRPHSLTRKKQGALLCRSTPPKRKPFFVVGIFLQENGTTVNHAVSLHHVFFSIPTIYQSTQEKWAMSTCAS